MTRDETKKAILVIAASYPGSAMARAQGDQLTFTINAWAAMLRTYDYEQFMQALQIYIVTDASGFPPSIGQVIDKMHYCENASGLSEMEAWGLVSKALRNSGYHAREEFDALPKEVQNAVGSPGVLEAWAQSSADSVETVIQSNFMRSYRGTQVRNREFLKLPAAIQEKLAGIMGGMENAKKLEDKTACEGDHEAGDAGQHEPAAGQ